ncbi:MAG: RluA family pseudouridine synthase [Rhodospirillaceae bacterium]|jgi:23S rRNA pseudouridine955/2504/2580 synthase|nr:RluA family pseudouridine synthase [Rhodospirillaceae bacterium]MBT4046441.1 RluA family pseudouridine synthase [Rhodospirillaceae bacterium]MBT4687010.1 RluA family pseudouridine synthase [Rhodospirillaceae bacterium]MBT5080375.1 RluA family pseudouridine synthase [Rhodospirillaceae bacterium]MBT5522733.1 RluA family pseudouridine synthase [Rhodospirillaceae bacterium]
MSEIQMVPVGEDEGEVRLDRWFKRHYPTLSHGRLEKMLRKGQVRVDGDKVKAGHRLTPGQMVRIPPLDTPPPPKKRNRDKVSDQDAKEIRNTILHQDKSVLVIDKPAGLAVQGGSGTTRHVDGMLDALQFEAAERPRLVHRLDRDTTGILVLARHARAATALTGAFRDRDTEKLYWAIVAGVPPEPRGHISLPLAKTPGPDGERVRVDRKLGKQAITDYVVIEHIGDQAAWLALWPRTGRTHQLRAHCAAIGTPILGDGKYGGVDATLPGMALSKGLHLHARAITLPHPDGGTLSVEAPAPAPFRKTMQTLGFNPEAAAERMAELQAEEEW